MAIVKPNYYFHNGFVHRKNSAGIMNDKIITVNYLLSAGCQLNCVYCIARDVMQNYCMPSKEQVDAAIEKILKLDPLVTVLTGGEPLLSPYLKYVIERLSGKTNLMIDTNGLLLKEHDTDFFRKHNVTIRVTIDLPLDIYYPTKVTPLYKGGLELLDNLEYLNKNDYSFVISTTISNYNVDWLILMLTTFFLHGPVLGWRLQNIIPCHNIDFSTYINDINGKPKDFNEKKNELIELLKTFKKKVPHRAYWIMQISDNYPEYSTVMIMPDGSLAISNKSDETREILDEEQLIKRLSISDHKDRYIANIY